MELTALTAFVAAVFLISIVPGPDMMFIIANAARGGRGAGLVAAAGMSTGLGVHTVAAAFGLGALIQAAPVVLDGVRIAGAVFLIYLAVSAWRASRQPPGRSENARPPPRLAEDRQSSPRSARPPTHHGKPMCSTAHAFLDAGWLIEMPGLVLWRGIAAGW